MNTTDKILEELDVLIEDSLRNSKPIGAIFCDARRTIANYRARIAEFWDALETVREQRDEARDTVESLTTTASDLLTALGNARNERDEARGQRDRLAEALRECREDSYELLAERDWWKNETRIGYQERYKVTLANTERATAALQSLTQNAKP